MKEHYACQSHSFCKRNTYEELKEVVLEPEKAVVMNGQLLFCLLNDYGVFDSKFLFWYMRYYDLKVTVHPGCRVTFFVRGKSFLGFCPCFCCLKCECNGDCVMRML